MSRRTSEDGSVSPSRIDKGKARATEPSERTPLLRAAHTPSEYHSELDQLHPHPPLWRQLCVRFAYLLALTLLLCALAFGVFAAVAWSYAARAQRVSPDDVLNRGLVFRGPHRVDVLNVTEAGAMYVDVELSVGVDVGAVMDVNSDPDDNILDRTWKSLGRWGVKRLDRVSVEMGRLSLADGDVVLGTLDIPPIELPLTTNPPRGTAWLTTMTTRVFVQPTNKTMDLVHFARRSWKDGFIRLHVDVDTVVVSGGTVGDPSWRRRVHQELNDVSADMKIEVPAVPGLPNPGHNFPPVSELITLKDFSVASGPSNLLLSAEATIVDPAPDTFNITTPALPFFVSLPRLDGPPFEIASISTAPFTLTHPNITLHISGNVLPLTPDATHGVLSEFLTRYLSAQPNPIIISTPLLLNYTLETDFPAPDPKPRVLRNVTIHDMRIKPIGTTFYASGTVYARVVLPRGVDVDLNVSRVLPDVIVFDGEVPDDVDNDHGLPDPLPERAFGRLQPEDWIPADSTPDDKGEGEEDEGSALAVRAEIVDVPLEVLPGRQKEFSNFVSKVIFGTGGATAGILGTTAVGVSVHGLPVMDDGKQSEMNLRGLPFRGNVKVGKK
ncbi:hypothetical protein BD626DRAFT_157566 [Schizophyllum amplum]|uniref:Uncharacterized protein n=1 Tax=Schizophyllum amplum TaxID=97359 RepID=A0A550C3B3_9AGAR|nr:hypothetical protein BD626DRAFT_157566 [Auriculariopsis ampla]